MLGFLGQQKTEPETSAQQSQKSESFEKFVQTPEVKNFVSEWSNKTNPSGEQLYTKRGVTRLLGAIFGSRDTDKKVLQDGKEILSMLGGMDGLKGFFAGWKASTEGLIKGLKQIVGSK